MEGDRTLVNGVGGNVSDDVANSFLESPRLRVQSSAGDEEENEGGNVSRDPTRIQRLEIEALRCLRSDLLSFPMEGDRTLANVISGNFSDVANSFPEPPERCLQVQSSPDDEEEKEGRNVSDGPIRVLHSRSQEIQALRLECAYLHEMLASSPDEKGKIHRMWQTFIQDSLELDNSLAKFDRKLKELNDARDASRNGGRI